MNIIKNNPYRIVGILAGATAKEQTRQVKRLKQFIEAEQKPQDDFSFLAIGNVQRTLTSVEEASSKLNLDSDKINAAIFWFWNGNPISDEAAFDALENGDIETAYQIWDNLITKTDEDGNRYWKTISEKNYSAYHNCSIINLIKTNGNLHNAIMGNLYFLESDLVTKFVSSVADETYKTSKKELQLFFLNQIQKEIETNKKISLTNFLEIVNNQEFVAKQDFMKSFVQKPIELIEQKIETAKNKRKVNKANADKAGQELFSATATDLTQLKNIVGSNDLKYTSIADKISNEILQCSIDYFNDSQEKDSSADYLENAMNLAKLAKNIAVGNLARERVNDSIDTLNEMKDREISQALQLLKSVKDAYEENKRKITQEVKNIEATDIQIILGHRSINWDAVQENIKNSINWQNVNELLVDVLSDRNLKKIKESDKSEQKKEFLELANWIKVNSLRNSTITSIINKYKNIPPKLPFKILSSDIFNTGNKPLYTKYIRYIKLNLKVQVSSEKSVTFYLKYITPNGYVDRNEKTSPKGYSFKDTENLNLQTKNIEFSGWGSTEKCTYDIGRHRIEVYVDDYMIHSKDFVVDIAPSEKLTLELKKAEDKLKEIKNAEYFKSELNAANLEMSEIQKFQLFRSNSTRQIQITEQQKKIDDISNKALVEKQKLTEKQNKIIFKLKSDIQNAEY